MENNQSCYVRFVEKKVPPLLTLGRLKTGLLLEEEDYAVVRKERFTTFERVQFQELTVIKGNGKREPFDRDKNFKIN